MGFAERNIVAIDLRRNNRTRWLGPPAHDALVDGLCVYGQADGLPHALVFQRVLFPDAGMRQGVVPLVHAYEQDACLGLAHDLCSGLDIQRTSNAQAPGKRPDLRSEENTTELQ